MHHSFIQRTIALLVGSAILVPAVALAYNNDNPQRIRNRSPQSQECVQKAIDVREQAILSAYGVFSADMLKAFQGRRSALQVAWGNEYLAQRKAAIKSVWNAFNQAKKAAQKGFKVARESAWQAFRAAARTCGTPKLDQDQESRMTEEL